MRFDMNIVFVCVCQTLIFICYQLKKKTEYSFHPKELPGRNMLTARILLNLYVWFLAPIPYLSESNEVFGSLLTL